MLSILLVAVLICLSDSLEQSDRPLSKVQKRKSFTQLIFSLNNDPIIKERASCDWLGSLKRQKKLCLKRRGLPEAIIEAKELAVKYCEETFRYDQWNCSFTGPFFKKVYRETALMYSIASSALTYVLGKACSKGTVAGCKCGDRDKNENNNGSWHWGGCGDNTKFAKRFANKFLQIQKRTDEVDAILKHNAQIGIKLVAESPERVCRCHGVSVFSGACNVRTCWKQVPKFEVISQHLKKLYHKANPVGEAINNVRGLNKKLSSAKFKKGLVYLEESPNFCPSTVHRICKDLDNCATLCCGRGFYNSTQMVQICEYRMAKYQLQCDKQFVNKSLLICK